MFLTLIPSETVWGRKASCLRWEGDSCYRSMCWSVLMGSVRQERGVERVWWVVHSGRGTEHKGGDPTRDGGCLPSHPSHLPSPPGSAISCRTRPSRGLRFTTCVKGAIYPLSLPHRLLFRCNKIMALRLLLSTINIGNFYHEQFLLTADL